nr:hypothetical protein [Tanacetum cinerariifolium]
MFEKHMLEGECVLVDDDGKLLKSVDYPGNQNSEDETKYVDNEMTGYLTSKPSGVRYSTKSLVEQWRETYVNNDYNHTMTICMKVNIPDNIQYICDNLDIKMEKEDPTIVTKSLVNELDNFIEKLSSDEHVKNTYPLGSQSGSLFASVLNEGKSKKVVKITEMRNMEKVAGAAVAIPIGAVNEVIENEPWLIRLVPMILNIWTPNATLKRDEIKVAPVWVKLHNVPIMAYSKIGLSLITTQLGRPIMLDTYTSSMCLNPWGKITYTRDLIEISSATALLDSVVVAIPFLMGMAIRWRLLRLSMSGSPQEKGDTSTANENKEPNDKQDSSNQATGPKVTEVAVKNSFDALTEDVADVWEDASTWTNAKHAPNVINESDSEDVDQEIIIDQPITTTENNTIQGASTPSLEHWSWCSNGTRCLKGTRIILGWNSNVVDVSIISQDDQTMYTRIWIKTDKKELFCSFIFAHNRYTQRRALWESLGLHMYYVRNIPWCIMGDFNASLNLEDMSMGSSNIDISIREFKEYVEAIEILACTRLRRMSGPYAQHQTAVMTVIDQKGLRYTWNQKPKGDSGILKKLDRIMANMQFSNVFVGAYVVFQPYRNSDHAPVVLKVPLLFKSEPRPFKFYNVLFQNPRFKNVVLKKPLRKLMYDNGNLHTNVEKLRFELDKVQTDLDVDPTNLVLREEEAVYATVFSEALIMEERFLKQKAKTEWLRVGDSNSAFFHKCVKGRINRNRIDSITNPDRSMLNN